MPGSERSFYVQSWMTNATYVIAAIQALAAGLLVALGGTIAVGPVIPAMFGIGALLTAYQAFWTSRTPLAVVASDHVLLRPALLARPVKLRFVDVRAFARIPPGWLVFLARDGEETRMPLTALSASDADTLVELLLGHLTEVSYVDD